MRPGWMTTAGAGCIVRIGLGEATEFLWDQTRLSAMQKAGFATLVNFLPQWLERPRFELRSSFDDFDVFRSHDDGTGDWRLGLSCGEGLQSVTPGVTVNRVEKGDTILATLINTNLVDVIAEVPLQDDWLACEPLSGQLHTPTGGVLKLNLGAGQYRHFLLLQTPRAPRLLYALGARLPAHQTYEPGARKMRIQVDAVEGERVRMGVFTPAAVRDVTGSKAGRITFSWKQDTSLLTFETAHVPGELLEVNLK